MENKKEIKRVQVIFLVALWGSIGLGYALGFLSGSYWVAFSIILVGALSSAIYIKRVTDRYKLGDERSDYIDGRASALAFKISFATSGVLLAVISGVYVELEVQIPLLVVLGPIVALMGVTHGVASYHYAKKYS